MAWRSYANLERDGDPRRCSVVANIPAEITTHTDTM